MLCYAHTPLLLQPHACCIMALVTVPHAPAPVSPDAGMCCASRSSSSHVHTCCRSLGCTCLMCTINSRSRGPSLHHAHSHDHTSTQRCGQLHLLPPGLLACWPVMKRAGVLPAGVTVPGIYTRPLTVHRCCCTAACSPELQLHCLEQHAVLWQLAVEGSGQHSRRYS